MGRIRMSGGSWVGGDRDLRPAYEGAVEVGELRDNSPSPGFDELRDGAPWPLPAQTVIRVRDDARPDYAVDVELRLDPVTDEPVPTGIRVRTQLPMKPGSRVPEWPKDTQLKPISTRNVQRLPLGRLVEAAVTTVRQLKSDDPNRMDEVAKVFAPEGRPSGRSKERFYKAVAEAYRGFTAQGLSPAKEIARRKRVSENTVYQWFFKARELGFLEPSPRTRKRRPVRT